MVNYPVRLRNLVISYRSDGLTTLKSVSKKLGISRPHLSNLLAGRRNPSKRLSKVINNRFKYRSSRFGYQVGVQYLAKDAPLHRTSWYPISSLENIASDLKKDTDTVIERNKIYEITGFIIKRLAFHD